MRGVSLLYEKLTSSNFTSPLTSAGMWPLCCGSSSASSMSNTRFDAALVRWRLLMPSAICSSGEENCRANSTTVTTTPMLTPLSTMSTPPSTQIMIYASAFENAMHGLTSEPKKFAFVSDFFRSSQMSWCVSMVACS